MDRFGMSEDNADRCSQFMRYVGCHLAAEVQRADQVGVHLIEGGCQLAQLIARANRNLMSQVSPRHDLRCCR